MIVWGGGSGAGLNSGGIYDPYNNVWSPTNTTEAPAIRRNHTAVWTGFIGDSHGSGFQYNLNNNGDTGKMIVWGGYSSATYINTGGIYQP